MAAGLINKAPTAADTPAGKERRREYLLALGEFVDTFAKAEMAMALALWHYARTPHTISRAVFSGVRVKEAAQFIGRLAEVSGASPQVRAELKYLFDHLGNINGARNDLLHFGAISVEEGNAIVTNALKALDESRVTSFPVSPTILQAMTGDLWKIIFHLHSNHLGRAPLHGAVVQKILRSPWRYKHQPQTQSKNKKAAKSPKLRGRAPKPPRSPSSSQA